MARPEGRAKRKEEEGEKKGIWYMINPRREEWLVVRLPGGWGEPFP